MIEPRASWVHGRPRPHAALNKCTRATVNRNPGCAGVHARMRTLRVDED